MVAAMLDDTMAVGGLFKIGGGYVVPTLEMKVNFVRPATTDEVFAEGWLVHAGRTVAFLGGLGLQRARRGGQEADICALQTRLGLPGLVCGCALHWLVERFLRVSRANSRCRRRRAFL